MSLKNKPKQKKRKRFRFNLYSDFIKLFGGWGVYLYYRPKIYRISQNVPKRIKGSVIIASNHTSLHDPVILFAVFWYRRLCFLATKDIFKTKINRFFFKGMNCILVDKEKLNMSAIRTVCDRLNQKGAMVIFPEGGLNKTENLLDFKDGVAFMAKKSNSVVLPVYIVPRTRKYQRTSVVIGEPVDISALCRTFPKGKDIKLSSEYLYKREIELKEYYETHVKRVGGI